MFGAREFGIYAVLLCDFGGKDWMKLNGRA
jgi:hypothetical protein